LTGRGKHAVQHLDQRADRGEGYQTIIGEKGEGGLTEKNLQEA